MPHAYLRVCYSESGDSVVMHQDTLLFGIGEQWVSTKSQDSRIQVASARAYEAGQTDPTDAVAYDIPHPYAYVHAIHHQDQDDSEEISQELGGVTTTAATVTTEPQSPELSQMIEAAKEALDLDALTYSPVYGCFLENQYYSHHEDECVDECADGEAVAHGQCVRAEVLDVAASFQAEWELGVHCSDLCGADAANETLHTVRLRAAGLLDVPFQEVTAVSMQWAEAAARRLEQEARVLVLQVSVTTRRVSADVGEPLLGALLTEAPAASGLLQLQVVSVEQLSGPVDVDPDLSMGEGSDPYELAYEYLEPSEAEREAAAGNLLRSLVLAAAAATAAATAVLLGAVLGVLLWRKRLRARRAREVVASKVADPWDAVPGVQATEIGQPDVEENNTGAGVL
ncbi:unnamed protein product [Prorocentrum cordatum]|nr:unnamed protein product [Polarella glacialis]